MDHKGVKDITKSVDGNNHREADDWLGTCDLPGKCWCFLRMTS